MSEKWVSTHAGRHLRGRRKTSTSPERELRRALHALGLRYRLHRTLAKGCTPDIVFPGARLAVFVDGCFWHGCPTHGRTTFNGPNADLWLNKMRRNREHDARADTLARAAGFEPLRVWECAVRADAPGVALKIKHRVSG